MPTQINAESIKTLKWIEKTVSWHENGLLTDIEIEQFLKHLDKKKTIDLGSNVFENILTK